MVVDRLENLEKYASLNPLFAKAMEYLKAQKEFEELLTAIIARISLFDESIVGIQAKDCTYRIYRDTRFSSDKTPYKIHLGGYINALSLIHISEPTRR